MFKPQIINPIEDTLKTRALVYQESNGSILKMKSERGYRGKEEKALRIKRATWLVHSAGEGVLGRKAGKIPRFLALLPISEPGNHPCIIDAREIYEGRGDLVTC
jgi:hypothetical protein